MGWVQQLVGIARYSNAACKFSHHLYGIYHCDLGARSAPECDRAHDSAFVYTWVVHWPLWATCIGLMGYRESVRAS